MVFTEQQLQVKKLVDVKQDIEIDALNNGVSALNSTMQNGFTETTNNFLDIQNNLESMNLVANDRYNEFTGAVDTLSNAITQGFESMGQTIIETNDGIQTQFNEVNIELQNIQNNFELVNTNISESINAYNEQITNSLSVDMLSANTLIYNISEKPISSLTALGYDASGRVRPVTVIANHNVVLPENAGYIYTDVAGQPYAGNVDNVVSESENLVTSHAVYNEVNTLQNDLAYTQGLAEWICMTFNGLQPMNHIYPGARLLTSTMADYTNVEKIEFGKGYGPWGNVCSETAFGTFYNWDPNTNILKFYSVSGTVQFNRDMGSTFENCSKLNQNIQFNTRVTPLGEVQYISSMDNCFIFCSNLDQNIKLPNECHNYYRTFMNCSKLNQNILIPLEANEVRYMFMYCTNLNQNIRIPTNTDSLDGMFWGCYNLNKSIPIPANVTSMESTFMECNSFNRPVHVPGNIMYMRSAFEGCTNLRENIYLYGVSNMASNCLLNTFLNCPLPGNKYIHIPKAVPLSTSNSIYNCLVNNYTGVNWTGHIKNDR